MDGSTVESLSEDDLIARTERVGEGVAVENCAFEAFDPLVFEWYVESFGPDVNRFVDDS